MLWFDSDRGDDGKKFQYKAEHLSHTSPLSTPFFYTCCTCHFARWELFLATAACVEWKCIFTSPPFCLLFFLSCLKWMEAYALYIHIGADQQEHNRCFKREKVCLQCLFCYAVNRETNTWTQKPFTHEYLLSLQISSGNITFDFRSIGDLLQGLGESTGLPTSRS